MLEREADVDYDNWRAELRAMTELVTHHANGLPVGPERPAVDEAQVLHVVAEAARQRSIDTDHFSGKLLVSVVAAITIAVAISAHSLSLGIVAVQMVVGLLLVGDAWGLRARLPLVSSESRTQAAVGWIGLLVLALLVRQIAAIWS